LIETDTVTSSMSKDFDLADSPREC
jgi:hypothetical protein